MRFIDLNLPVGEMESGPLRRISDVPGVSVGHCTVINERHQTGVTVVLPCADDPFERKLPCACYVLNGFGRSLGLMQIDELGQLETPIALTNTLNVGKVHDALVSWVIGREKEKGVSVRTLNPVVCECNDASLNDIEDRVIGEEEVFSAFRDAKADFPVGAVGAGRGMTCHGLKGGIGSASRVIRRDGKAYTVGVLALTNHGRLHDLRIGGEETGREIERRLSEDLPDKGSCILILATDLPASDRQLRRILKRCAVGLIRLGSFIGHGSGEVFLGFSTANRIPREDASFVQPCLRLNEDMMDAAFRAAAECAEEAILDSLAAGETVTGYSGKVRRGLMELWSEGNRE